jgi:hypothetical protein
MTRIGELGISLAVISNRSRLQLAYSGHPDDGSHTFLRNVVLTGARTAFFIINAVKSHILQNKEFFESAYLH